MPSFENLVAIATLIAFVGVGVFGVLSWLNVDSEKRKSVAVKIQKWGPFVSESILTEREQKFATLRNICVICVFGLPIAFAIMMTLKK